MRRVMPILAFALFLAVPLWAQRGGGHGGGGHGGGFSSHGGGFSGHGGFSGGHFSGGTRGGFSGGFNRGGRSAFSRNPYLHDGFRNNGFRNNRFGNHDRFILRTYGYGYGRYGRGGWGYPWWGWGYDPWLWDWWDNDSSYDNDYNDNLAIANQMNEQSLEEQQMMRQEQADGDQDMYYARPPHRAPEPSSSSAPSGDPIVAPTVLVFRDQHQQEIRNYAIVGQMLWNFAPEHTQKIPLSELDLAATEKANDDRGITFRVPGSGEGQ